MRADISRRLALDTPNSKALSSGGNDCPLSPLSDCKLGAESKPQDKGAGQLSEDKIQKLRTFSLQQITLTVNQLSSCKDHTEASKLLETFLGNILTQVMEAYRLEGITLHKKYVVAKTALHQVSAQLGKRVQEKNHFEQENHRLSIENMQLREQNRFLMMELHKRDQPPSRGFNTLESSKDVF